MLEDIRLGSINKHGLELSREMVLTSKIPKPGDILIKDRGFISRELLNELKSERGYYSTRTWRPMNRLCL
jgi:hypothetical protein